MYHYDHFIAVTNRNLLQKQFFTDSTFVPGSTWYAAYLAQIDKIAATNVSAVVLREKDLTKELYCQLAKDCITICKKHNTRLILHNFLDAAHMLCYPYIHLSLQQLKAYQHAGLLSDFEIIGTSVHSTDDAILAETLSASYLFAGNIYETDCKAGLPGRGLSFLNDVCTKTKLPVYAIGGMNTDRLSDVMQAGAAGACMMSGFMKL